MNNLNELMSDIEIGIPTHFMGGGIFQENGNNRWYRIRLEDDLGITDIQNQIRKTVQESTEKRIEELKSELRKMLYYTEWAVITLPVSIMWWLIKYDEIAYKRWLRRGMQNANRRKASSIPMQELQ